MIFLDRTDAGQQLAEQLAFLKGAENVIVLGIPRGGVVVAAEVACALGARLDVFIAHKIGAPFNPELAIGALTSTGEVFLDELLVDELRLQRDEIESEIEHWREEIARRIQVFRRDLPPTDLENKIVVVVDDGVATGSTMLAALRALRKQKPARLILAVPVGPAETIARLARECDQAIVLATPEPFWAVGRFYARFDQTSDDQVIRLLTDAVQRMRRNVNAQSSRAANDIAVSDQSGK
jgi:predicted phosphoribosyltransferase